MITYHNIDYRVRAIERFTKPMSVPIPSDNIGLRVVEESSIKPGEVFWLGEPKYVGAFPPREDVPCKPKKDEQ